MSKVKIIGRSAYAVLAVSPQYWVGVQRQGPRQGSTLIGRGLGDEALGLGRIWVRTAASVDFPGIGVKGRNRIGGKVPSQTLAVFLFISMRRKTTRFMHITTWIIERRNDNW